MNRHRFAVALFALTGITSVATSGLAAEVLVYDDTFDFDESEHGFHYFQPPAAMPTDWLSPDDFYDGTFALRFEIFSQATSRESNLQFCIWFNDGNETCSTHTLLSGPGSIATHESSPSTWWTKDGPVDFAHPENIDRLGMPLWNDDPCVVSDWASSFCWEDRADYFPMRVRLTVVAISSGSTFSGWDNYIGELDAGPEASSDAGDASGGDDATDTGAAGTAGGGGSGGSSAAGGTGGSSGSAPDSGVPAADSGVAASPSTPTDESDDGCGCRIAPRSTKHESVFWWAIGVIGLLLRRRSL